jgi:hypothetical protein
VAQTAAVLVLEPIFKADLQPEQYAYRRDRSALDAVRQVHKRRDVAWWFRCCLSVAGSFVCRCLTSRTMLRFHIPLIEPHRRVYRIRLSEKTEDDVMEILKLAS